MNSQAPSPSVVINMVMDSVDLPFLKQAAESFNGNVEEVVKNETGDLLAVEVENFDTGIIPAGKSGFVITLPAEMSGNPMMGFWKELSRLKAANSQKESQRYWPSSIERILLLPAIFQLSF